MSKLRTMLPVEVRRAGRYGLGLVRDVFESSTGNRDDGLPPHRLRFVGHGDFKFIGDQTVSQLIDLAGLEPDHEVLDVGCGIGRVAIPLSGYLSPAGSYHGFDIVPRAIRWCQENLGGRHPNLHFEHIDVRNTRYRRTAGSDAATFRFPFPDERFDVVFATSVFTHLVPESTTNYVNEIARVLRRGGTSFTSWYLLNPEVRTRIADRRGPLSFRWDYGTYAVDDKRVAEAVTAYDESFVRRTFVEAGLTIREPIELSSWSGGPAQRPGQDIVLARKAPEVR